MIVGLSRRLLPVLLATALVVHLCPARLLAQAGEDPETVFRSIIAPALNVPLSDLPPQVLVQMQAGLEQLTLDHPESNIALLILLGETVEGIDLAEVRRLASAAPQDLAVPDEPAIDNPVTAPAPDDPEPAVATSPAAVVPADAGEDAPPRPSAEAAAEPPAIGADPAPSAVADEAAAPPPAGTPEPAEPTPSQIVYANLPAAITACLSVGLLPPQDLQLRVALGPDGHVIGVPQILNQDQNVPGLREAYLRALLTIDGCSPLRSEAGEGVVIVLISPDGMVTARLEDTADVTSAAAAPADTAVPSVPAEAFLPTDARTEAELNLAKKDVREIQARLQVLGFDPKGIDGVLGRGARAAIGEWQTRQKLPATGFLGKAQLQLLGTLSDAAYGEWIKDDANRRLVETGGTRSGGTGRYIDQRGCLREANGKAVPNFKAGCR